MGMPQAERQELAPGNACCAGTAPVGASTGGRSPGEDCPSRRLWAPVATRTEFIRWGIRSPGLRRNRCAASQVVGGYSKLHHAHLNLMQNIHR